MWLLPCQLTNYMHRVRWGMGALQLPVAGFGGWWWTPGGLADVPRLVVGFGWWWALTVGGLWLVVGFGW